MKKPTAVWAKGWDEARVHQELSKNPKIMLGFKKRSEWAKKLRLGNTYKRRFKSGPVTPCTPHAVHLSYDPFFSVYGHDYLKDRTIYVGIMRVFRGQTKPTKTLSRDTKWAGKEYTLIAKITLGARYSLAYRFETRSTLLDLLGLKGL